MLRQTQHERITLWFLEFAVHTEFIEVQFFQVPFNGHYIRLSLFNIIKNMDMVQKVNDVACGLSDGQATIDLNFMIYMHSNKK